MKQSPDSLLALLKTLAQGLVKSLPRMLMIGLMMSVLTWFAHTYIIAKVNDGLMYVSGNVRINSIVHLQKTHFLGVNAFWGLLSYFLSSFALRIFSLGPQKWFQNIIQLPAHIKRAFLGNTEQSPIILIIGAMMALVVAAIYRNFMLTWILALGMVLVMTAHGQCLEALVMKVALLDIQRLIKQKLVSPGQEGDAILMLFLGLFSGFLMVGFWRARFLFTFVFGVLLMGLLVFIKAKGFQKFAVFCFFVLGGLLLMELRALAWCEGASFSRAGGSWTTWWGSNNADVVRRLGILPSLSSLLGGSLGSAAGSATSSLASLGEQAVSQAGGEVAVAGQAVQWEGRDYQEGQNYTFDDGREYQVQNGEFVPVRDLKDGEAYTDMNGDRRVWVGGQPWYESDWNRQQATNEANLRAHREDAAREQARRRAEAEQERREAEERRAEMEREKDQQAWREKEERREAIRREMEKAKAEGASADRWAAFWNVMTTAAEGTKFAADKGIDILAKVTGPKGKSIRKAYRATSALAGGVGEGMASGNWQESMVEAGGEALGNVIEDSIGTDRYKKGFQVFREGTSNAYKAGKKAYKAGDDDVMGAAALGFLEGAADKTSGLVKDSLKGGGKAVYGIGESAAKGGYNAAKEGGHGWDVLGGAAGGAGKGVVGVGVDYTMGEVMDAIIPETGAVSPEEMAKHQWKLFQNDRQDVATEMLDEWIPDYVFDEVRNATQQKAGKGITDYLTG